MAASPEAADQHVSFENVGHVHTFDQQTFARAGGKTVGRVEKRGNLHQRVHHSVFVGHDVR